MGKFKHRHDRNSFIMQSYFIVFREKLTTASKHLTHPLLDSPGLPIVPHPEAGHCGAIFPSLLGLQQLKLLMSCALSQALYCRVPGTTVRVISHLKQNTSTPVLPPGLLLSKWSKTDKITEEIFCNGFNLFTFDIYINSIR